MNRYVIIGSGVAGYAAAEAIRSQDPGGEITMLTDDPYGFYSRPGLAYYLTGELPEKLLFPLRKDDLKQLKIKLNQGYVSQIDIPSHKIHLESGESLPYDRLLIAVGAQAMPLKVPGADLAGVVKLDHLADARLILGLARKARHAVVVGGGITALELVEGLLACNLKVHYFLRGDRYWSGVLDETESRTVEQLLVEHGVTIHYETELKAILGKKGRVVGVQTAAGTTIQCEMVAYAIGIRPRLHLAHSCGLLTDRGILVDEKLQTSANDVFAAGDVAQVYDPSSGKSVLDSLWNPARQQGHHAGMNMAGLTVNYQKPLPFNVTRLAGLTTTIIGIVGIDRAGSSENGDPDLKGIARGDSETWRDLPDAITAQTGFNINRLRLMVGEKYLLGALVMGEQKLSHPLQRMIIERADITSIRKRLLEPGAPISDLIIDFYSAWRAQHDSHPQP